MASLHEKATEPNDEDCRHEDIDRALEHAARAGDEERRADDPRKERCRESRPQEERTAKRTGELTGVELGARDARLHDLLVGREFGAHGRRGFRGKLGERGVGAHARPSACRVGLEISARIAASQASGAGTYMSALNSCEYMPFT